MYSSYICIRHSQSCHLSLRWKNCFFHLRTGLLSTNKNSWIESLSLRMAAHDSAQMWLYSEPEVDFSTADYSKHFCCRVHHYPDMMCADKNMWTALTNIITTEREMDQSVSWDRVCSNKPVQWWRSEAVIVKWEWVTEKETEGERARQRERERVQKESEKERVTRGCRKSLIYTHH